MNDPIPGPTPGDIFRGDLRRGTASRFIDAPAGRQALGMVVDVAHDLLFVAGGFTGQAYVYDASTGEPVASYQFDPQRLDAHRGPLGQRAALLR